MLASASTAHTAQPIFLIGGRIWTLSDVDARTGIVRLGGLDATTLATVVTDPVSLGPHIATDSTVAFAANATKDQLYIGYRHEVITVDTRNPGLLHTQLAPGGPIAAMAASPDGKRLYLTSAPRSRTTVIATDATGFTTAGLVPTGLLRVAGGTGANGISASNYGIWIEAGTGNADHIMYHPAADLARAPIATEIYGVGGFPVTSTVTSSAVWEGGSSAVACSSPTTGQVRASAPVPTANGRPADIYDLTAAGGTVFAAYQNPNSTTGQPSLIKLHPPKRCY